MGGKTKNVPRTKDNVKPSSSSRSALLLAANEGTSSFIGFSGLKGRTPGFNATSEGSVDGSFEANIDADVQLIVRKMSKKDPLTKRKALQEFITMINDSDLDKVKSLLPIWPKLYISLANDVDYSVRELSQKVLQLITAKCKRAIAPYLKQLVPVWVSTRFDNYAPAATVAALSFNETFVGNTDRTQEVCLHCQSEIVEYSLRNITFHTPATLSNGKNLTAEEAEQKYQRLMVCSLKLISFLIEHNSGDDLRKLADGGLSEIWMHPKFWSFSKHKLSTIKAAWFEFSFQLLHTKELHQLVTNRKDELIAICFQNLNDADLLTAPFVWGCILLIQNIFPDWHTAVDIQKVVLPKLSQLIRSGFNRNATAICPHILPFLANMRQNNLGDVLLNDFLNRFFDDFRSSVLVTVNIISRSDYVIITKTFFECLQYVLQRISNDITRPSNDFGFHIFEANCIGAIDWSLATESNVPLKCFFHHICGLIVFLTNAEQFNESTSLYAILYNTFWVKIDEVLAKEIENTNIESRQAIRHFIELVQELSTAGIPHNSNLNKNVKFDSSRTEEIDAKTECSSPSLHTTEISVNVTRNRLRSIVVRLLRMCLDKVKLIEHVDEELIRFVRSLTSLYSDRDFYVDISGDDLQATVNMFTALAVKCGDSTTSEEPAESSDTLLDIVFEILEKASKSEQFDYIKNNLLKLELLSIQIRVLQRLISYPLCMEPKTRELLAEPICCDIIQGVTLHIVSQKCKKNIGILRTCFYQPVNDILISQKSVDAIIRILSDAIVSEEPNEMTDSLCSFIAEIMPTICMDQNASEEVKYEVFQRLFKFSIEKEESEHISDDTLWEMMTCWQDALSAGDILISDELVQNCADVIEQHVSYSSTISVDQINKLACAIAEFVLCTMQSRKQNSIDINEPSTSSAAKGNLIGEADKILKIFLTSTAFTPLTIQDFGEFCVFVEALKGQVTVGVDLKNPYGVTYSKLKPLVIHALMYLDAISVVVNKSKLNKEADSEDENSNAQYLNTIFLTWSEYMCTKIIECLQIASMALSLDGDDNLIELSTMLEAKVISFMSMSNENITKITDILLMEASNEADPNMCRLLHFLIHTDQFSQYEDSATILLFEHLLEYFLSKNSFKAYVNTLQYFLPKLSAKSFTPQSAIMHTVPKDLWVRAVVFRSLIKNNFTVAILNENCDRVITAMILQYVTDVAEKQSNQSNPLLYNVDINKQKHLDVVNASEYANLLVDVLENFPHEMTIKNWDAVRLALSSWVLSISKSIENYTNPKVAIMTVSVFKLFATLVRFIHKEKQKSSSKLLTDVIDEWDNVFARNVNLVLFKIFYTLCNKNDIPESYSTCYTILLNEITPALEYIDFEIVYDFYKSSTTITLDNVNIFLLKNLSHRIHDIRMVSVFILRQLTRFYVAEDSAALEKMSSDSFAEQSKGLKWHHLNRFEDYLCRYETLINRYVSQFSFKLTEISEFEPIVRGDVLSYLLLWDCILYICSKSPIILRSTYTNWLQDNKYQETFLCFLFRCMPAEILKNHDSKIMSTDIFKGLTWEQMKDDTVSLEKYACHLYTEILRKLPAVVRKWWSTSPSRQKTFVEKLTTNFVSLSICNEELRALSNKKDRHENMQVSVHMSTREVLAVYSIDDARMELVITLAHNYPLGGVKVECGKQIGGRSNSRTIGMQLTIFLTHQNGTIVDGLTLWKNNLDKKFEGVEECYVCYTVIHQDTCQLPKLCCKTCKKKFHGPCLYKWFTTSSKSTCPICRNVF